MPGRGKISTCKIVDRITNTQALKWICRTCKDSRAICGGQWAVASDQRPAFGPRVHSRSHSEPPREAAVRNLLFKSSFARHEIVSLSLPAQTPRFLALRMAGEKSGTREILQPA
jgi:hypothetical protein